MKTERLADHHQAREALMLSVASVTAIMLTAYLLLLMVAQRGPIQTLPF
jgi:hypothetical protein